jgi:hypothetical protein
MRLVETPMRLVGVLRRGPRTRGGEGGATAPCGPRRGEGPRRGARGWGLRDPPGSVLLPPSSSEEEDEEAGSAETTIASSERKGIQSISAAIGSLTNPSVRIATHIQVLMPEMLLPLAVSNRPRGGRLQLSLRRSAG